MKSWASFWFLTGLTIAIIGGVTAWNGQREAIVVALFGLFICGVAPMLGLWE